MSGGHFEYNQYKIGDIADKIESIIKKSGRKKTKQEIKEERYWDPEWYEKYPEDLYHYEYSKEVMAEFKKAVKILRKAEIYVHEIDWLICGDTGDESFLDRLKKKLNNEVQKKAKI